MPTAEGVRAALDLRAKVEAYLKAAVASRLTRAPVDGQKEWSWVAAGAPLAEEERRGGGWSDLRLVAWDAHEATFSFRPHYADYADQRETVSVPMRVLLPEFAARQGVLDALTTRA